MVQILWSQLRPSILTLNYLARFTLRWKKVGSLLFHPPTLTRRISVEKAGGKGLACVVDIRDEGQIQSAVDAAVKKFGGIDILVNNASAISLTNTEDTDMKRYDLMHNINTRGTFLV